MTFYYLMNNLTLAILLLVVTSGAVRWHMLDVAMRVFWSYMVVTLVCEGLAYYSAIAFHNNLKIYAVFSVIEIFTVALYFNYTISFFKKRHIGIIIGAFGALAGIWNILLLQPIHAINSNFLVFSGILIISMSLLSITEMLIKYEFYNMTRSPHFWIAMSLIFFWTITFLHWNIDNYLTGLLKKDKWMVDLSLYLVSLITNIGIAGIFILYPKLTPRHAQ